MKQSLVIIGNGMATGRLLDDLLQRGVEHLSITVVGDEPVGGYNRIMLSPVLAGEIDQQSIIAKPMEWYLQQGIHYRAAERVIGLDPERKRILTQNQNTIGYDQLVLAVGSRPAKIGAGNQHLDGIFSFRSLADVDRIQRRVDELRRVPDHARAVVVGGGFLGLEAAYGIAQQGIPVTLIHRSGWLLNRQLDVSAAAYLQKIMEQKNIQFCLQDEVESFMGETELTGMQLKSGEMIDCKLCVIATGIVPNKELGEVSKLAGARGISVDAYMQTRDASVSALGECVEFEGQTFGLVEPIWQQSAVLANRLCNLPTSPFSNKPVATKLKVSGVQLFSAGENLTRPEHRELIYEDPSRGIYRKCLLLDGKLVGVVLFGDTQSGQDYFDLMVSATDVSDFAESLVLGKQFYDDVA